MKILIVEPGKHPRKAEIDGSLEGMQKTVGGLIQAVYPWADPVALICDEEALFKDCQWNRLICEGLAIKGTFFVCGIGEEDFDDLPDDLMESTESSCTRRRCSSAQRGALPPFQCDQVCAYETIA